MFNNNTVEGLKQEVEGFNAEYEALKSGGNVDLAKVRTLLEKYKALEDKVSKKNSEIETRNKMNQEQATALLGELNTIGAELGLAEASPNTIFADLETNINSLIKG